MDIWCQQFGEYMSVEYIWLWIYHANTWGDECKLEGFCVPFGHRVRELIFLRIYICIQLEHCQVSAMDTKYLHWRFFLQTKTKCVLRVPDHTGTLQKTLSEAQRTQGIASVTWIIFLTEINLKVASLVLVPSLAKMWCNLYYFQFWPLGGANCIGWEFGLQMTLLVPILVALLALVTSLATRWRLLQCHIALDYLIGSISWYWVGNFISQSHIS